MYLVEFTANDIEKNQAGFDVCLAIASLELPLTIIVDVENPKLDLALESLRDFDLAKVYYKKKLNADTYQAIKKAAFKLDF